MLLPKSYQYPNILEGADRTGRQLRRDKECPLRGVTSSGRVWRKESVSNAWSLALCRPYRCRVVGSEVNRQVQQPLIGLCSVCGCHHLIAFLFHCLRAGATGVRGQRHRQGAVHVCKTSYSMAMPPHSKFTFKQSSYTTNTTCNYIFFVLLLLIQVFYRFYIITTRAVLVGPLPVGLLQQPERFSQICTGLVRFQTGLVREFRFNEIPDWFSHILDWFSLLNID